MKKKEILPVFLLGAALILLGYFAGRDDEADAVPMESKIVLAPLKVVVDCTDHFYCYLPPDVEEMIVSLQAFKEEIVTERLLKRNVQLWPDKRKIWKN